jgi:hypothetical protein
MRKCLYGHALSGRFFVEGLLRHINSDEFKEASGMTVIQCQTEPAVLMSEDGELRAAIYVDDIIVVAQEELAAAFWRGIECRYIIGRAGPAGRFLGMMLSYNMKSKVRWLRIGMDEYAMAIVKAYEELAPARKWKVSNVPSTVDLRENRDDRVAKHAPGYAPQIVGMLLWWARVTRAEVMHPAGALGCVLHTWGDDAEEQLFIAACYARTWPAAASYLTASDGEGTRLVTYTDSNWMTPKSTSGWTCTVEGQADGSWTYGVVAHGSKGQGIPTVNSAEAELVAEFTAVRDTLGVEELMRQEGQTLEVRGDNKAAAVQASRGYAGRQSEASLRTKKIQTAWVKHIIDSGEMTQRRVDTKVNPANLHTKCVKNGVQNAYERRLNGVYTNEEFAAMYPSATEGVPLKGQRLVVRGDSVTETDDAVCLSQESPEGDNEEDDGRGAYAYGLDALFAQLPFGQETKAGGTQAQRA